MGRIRTKFVKTVSKQLMEKNPGKFSKDFKKNKETMNELDLVDEKLMRNKIAGYIVRLVRKKKF